LKNCWGLELTNHTSVTEVVENNGVESEHKAAESEKVIPHHDWLGLVGIQDKGEFTIYGVVPRFWHTSYSNKRQILDLGSNAHARILTQNKTTKMDKDEAKRLLNVFEEIKGIYTLGDDDVEEEGKNNGSSDRDNNLLEEDASKVLEKLFYLCEFYHNKKKKDKEEQEQEIDRGGLPIFLFEDFVEKLEKKTRELRRTYRTVVENAGAVRGRITTRGMMMMVARPSPMIECEYETFDIQAPLYKVMMSTLDVIRSTRLPPGFNFLENKFERVCRHSANLRMKMAEIPSLPLIAAIRECIKLNRRLPRMFRPFEKLIPIALRILKRESYRLKVDDEKKKWWHLTVRSSDLWELVLEESLNLSADKWKIKAQHELDGPWHVKKAKSIDFSVNKKDTDNVNLIDAKYSIAKKETPKSGYQYQQFFYAVRWASLPDNLKPPNAVTLLHPAIDKSEEEKNNHQSVGLVDDLKKLLKVDVKFNVWTLPFPQPDVFDSDDGIDGYLKDNNEKLKILLSDTID